MSQKVSLSENELNEAASWLSSAQELHENEGVVTHSAEFELTSGQKVLAEYSEIRAEYVVTEVGL